MLLHLLSSRTLETQKESGRKVQSNKVLLPKQLSVNICNTNKPDVIISSIVQYTTLWDVYLHQGKYRRPTIIFKKEDDFIAQTISKTIY